MSESNAEQKVTAKSLCGKWMPRKQTFCAKGPNHESPCASPESMERARRWNAARTRLYGKRENPVVRSRWARAYKLQRYGLTKEKFDHLLKVQGHACGMCRELFEEGDTIIIDHDHACCPAERKSCGKCVRGLLCLSCNTALGQIERKYAMARAYLARPQVGWAGSRKLEAS